MRTYELGGGKYSAVQNDDGSNTWNILDVPICGEVPKGAKFNSKDIDRAWLEAAVKKHQARLKSDNFKPPLHLEHHEPGVKTERAGEFIPHRVGKLQYNGKPTDVVFADLIRIPDHIFNRIEKGELPYLSVELGRWEDGEFSSLALMDDDAPFFRFPNLTIGTKVYSFTAEAERIAKPQGVAVAFRSTGTEGGGLILCKFGVGVKLDDEKKDEEKSGEESGEKFPKKDEAAGGEEKPTEKKDGEQVVQVDPQTEMLMLLRQMSKTLTILASAQTGVGAIKQSDKAEESNTPVEQEKPMSDEKDKKPTAQAASTDEAIKLQARVDALEAKDEERTKQDAIKARAEAAIASLKGWHINDKMRARIYAFAGDGQKPLDLYVESIKADVPKDPPTTFEAFSGSSTGASDPEAEKVLAHYQAKSPEVIEQARKFVSLHAEAKRLGHTRLPLDRFVEAQFMGASAAATVNGLAH